VKAKEYDALVKLMRGDMQSASNRAARRVLVDGISQLAARQEIDVSRAGVSNAVKRYADADKLIREAYGIDPDTGGR